MSRKDWLCNLIAFNKYKRKNINQYFEKRLKFKVLTQTQLENDKILSSNVQSYLFFFSGFTYSLIEFDHFVNYLTIENYLVRY